jgi:hypothetical protein
MPFDRLVRPPGRQCLQPKCAAIEPVRSRPCLLFFSEPLSPLRSQSHEDGYPSVDGPSGVPSTSGPNASGEVPEWPIGHAWKACVRVTVPRVRIPPSPFVSPRLARPQFSEARRPVVHRPDQHVDEQPQHQADQPQHDCADGETPPAEQTP